MNGKKRNGKWKRERNMRVDGRKEEKGGEVEAGSRKAEVGVVEGTNRE